MIKCKKCGCELQPGTKFCSVCGTKVGEICSGCGTEVEEGTRFCPTCGKKIGGADSEVVEKVRTEKTGDNSNVLKDSKTMNHAETGTSNSNMEIVGKNTEYYIAQFRNLQAGKKCKINWASFFLGLFHAAYRNVWKEWIKGPGIPQIVSALVMLIGGGVLFISGNTAFMAPVMVVVLIAQIVGMVIHILFACRFNRMYLKHVDEKAGKNDYSKDPSVPRAILVTVVFGIAISICQGIYSAGSMNALFSVEDMEIETSDLSSHVGQTEIEPSFQETEQIPGTEQESSNFMVGQTVFTNKFAFTVTDSYVLDYLGEGKKIPDGAVYVAIEYEYKNISKEPISSWSLPTVQLMDGNDAVYSQDTDASWYFDSYSDEKMLSDMNPGIKTRGAKIFEVAIDTLDAGGMRAYVQADQEFLVDLPLYYEHIAANAYEEGYLGNAKADSYYEEDWGANNNRYLYVVNCQESITLRYAPSTQAAEITQIPLYAAVEFLDIAENGFYFVSYNGMEGYALASYLDVYEPQVATGATCTVVNCNESITLRTSPSTRANEICQIPLGAIVYYIEAANDFYLITYNGQTGYALASYLQFN